jgi:immune inhibitor A
MPDRGGSVPPLVRDAFEAGRFTLPAAPSLAVSAATGTWKIPVILVDFTDQLLTYGSPARWDTALFDTTGATATGSVFDYYRWVSGNLLRVTGKVVATVHMPVGKNYYANNSWGLSSSSPRNSFGVVTDALIACETQVDWSEYDRDLDGYVDMLWVLHSGLGGENTVSRENLWSITSRLSSWTGGGPFMTSDPVPGTSLRERVDAFAILPEMSAFQIGGPAEIGVFCHEFGHALGLPDLYDTAPVSSPFSVGPGNWSLMSTGAYGTDGQSPQYPSHLGAWPTVFLGWRQTLRPARDTLVTLSPLVSGGEILELWFQGASNSEHFLVENRQRLGFDRNLVQEGAIVYQVDDLVIRGGIPSNRVNSGLYPGLRIIEGDGRSDLILGFNRGDPSDPMPGSTGLQRWADDTSPSSRSSRGNVTHVALGDFAPSGDDLRMFAQVRAPGWQPPRVQSGPGFDPLPTTGPGTRAVLLDDGSLEAVTSEMVGAVSQVVVRTRRPNGTWEPPVTVSQSSAGASEPSLCAIPGGDLCVAWSDARHGARELYFRSRIRGVWTSERRLTDLPGTSRGPALGADRGGGVHLTWLYNDISGVRVYFMKFTYLSPFGDPVPVTGPAGLPDLPALTVAPNSTSYIFWADRATFPYGLWFSRFVPDSGIRPPARLALSQGGTLPAVAAAADAQGRLHVLWALSGAGGSELHYQLRSSTVTDTPLVKRGEPIQDFMVAVDPEGGVHVVMEAAAAGGTQILYQEWRSNGGWDVGATEVTAPSEGVAVRPAIVARGQGSVTVVYTNYLQGVAALVERDRNVWTQPLTAVDQPVSAPRTWRVSPNPMRAGSAIRFAILDPGPDPGPLVVFDLAGRRMATAALVRRDGGWQAEIAAGETRSWTSGVYFARLPGRPSRARIVVLR